MASTIVRWELMTRKLIGHSISNRGNLVPKAFRFNILLSPSLAARLDREVDLEMAYNPNDCVELRWGAPAKSEEASTCQRYAPAARHSTGR
jgi:hypothetical protein